MSGGAIPSVPQCAWWRLRRRSQAALAKALARNRTLREIDLSRNRLQWRQAGATGEWFKVVDLMPGTHQYKFIIDGQWRHDHTAPTVLDNLGNVNNCTQVDASAVAQAAENAAAQQPTGGARASPNAGRASPGADARGSDGAARGGGGIAVGVAVVVGVPSGSRRGVQ